MRAISEAVILMAGSGSRLRKSGATQIKPLVRVLGRPLISYTLDALMHAGIKKVYAVVGFESESVMPQVQQLVPRELDFRFIANPEWEKQNGISLLAAAPHIHGPFFLTMVDHLFDGQIGRELIESADLERVNLAIDRKLDSIFDPDDATKVKTDGERIVAIGKDLKDYDAIDVGLFVCPPEMFDYLERSKRGGDCSLSDGVRLMATAGKARAIDIGNAWWQDVDTSEMLQHAEKMMSQRARLNAQNPAK